MGPTISGRPNTFVYWNTTLTSPTVYMAVSGTWVYQSAGSTISDQSRLLLPQSPDAVSTLAGKLGGGYHPPEKINYADFNYPVPASAYRAQPRCYEAPLSWSYYSVTQPLYSGGPTTTWEVATYSEFASENQCSTIYDDYRPILSIPPEFSSLTPAAQPGDTGSSDSDSMGQFSSYRAAVLSGLDTTIAIASAKSGGAVVADATLSAGESTSIPGIGNVIAISSGVIADGSTEVFSAIGTGAPESGRMTGAVLSRPSDSAITISQGSGEGAIIGSVTLSSGEQTHVSGIGNIVVQPSGVVVDGSTQAYSAITSSPESDSITNGDARAQEFTIDGKTYTASSATGGDVVIANDLSTATLDAAGDLATLGTVILSAGSSGHLVLGSSTVSVTAAPTASASTAGQQTFTAGSDGDYLIGSQTLTAGGAVTMSGTTYSRPTSGSGVVVDGMTQGFETGQRSESVSRSTEPSGSTSTSSTTGQEGSNFIVPGATAENTTPASGGGRVSTVGGVAGIVVAMALLNAM
ncbi:hypothetical protein BTJ68_11330 [Hortaea werneckii EXF-2000]|uniref:Uncharacterized protein n=1 Tax=Hortaea werneckii EXF-2000 TaxID=1157616 RepID=A0A1Z5SXD7_HORWE|nr:hypothetical protein BTJ68_11330 [Hortaea werneckii EXF-2000]